MHHLNIGEKSFEVVDAAARRDIAVESSRIDTNTQTLNFYALNWEQGNITSSGTSDHAKFIRSPEFYVAHTGNILEYNVASGYTLRILSYTTNGTYIVGLGDVSGHGFLKINADDVEKLKLRINNTSNTAVVPSEGYRAVTLRLFNGNVNAVTPQMYGAIGNGIHDDTAAFQSALNSGFDVHVPTSHNELYLITNTLIVPNTCKRIFGDLIPHGGTYQTGQIRFDISNTVASAEEGKSIPLFKLAWNTQGLSIAGIGASCAAIIEEGVEHRTGVFLQATDLLPENATSETPMIDKDIDFKQMYATNFYRAVIFKGRGFTCVDSAITSCNHVAQFEWIDDASDSNTEHPKVMNQRRILFKNCALHSITNRFFEINSGHAYGLEIIGCTADVGRGVIITAAEEAWNWNITGNVWQGLHCHATSGADNGAALQFNGGAKNCIISSNILSGDSAFWSDGYIPTNFLYMAGAVGCVISNNVFKGCNGDAIILGFVSADNKFVSSAASDGYRYRVSDKSIVSGSGYTLSDYIPVVPGDVIYCNQTLGSNNNGHALFDENKKVIDVIASKNPPDNSDMTFTIPNGIYWIKVSVLTSAKNTFKLTINKVLNCISICGNAFDDLPADNHYPVRFKTNATNVAFSGNTDTQGKPLYTADSGMTVGIYSNVV